MTAELASNDPTDRIKEWLRAGHNGDVKGVPGFDAEPLDIAQWLSQGRPAWLSKDMVRGGVKTGAPTVSMQIRMLESQSKLLKAASFVEDRPASAILRELLAVYFERKCVDPDLEERMKWINILLASIEWEE